MRRQLLRFHTAILVTAALKVYAAGISPALNPAADEIARLIIQRVPGFASASDDAARGAALSRALVDSAFRAQLGSKLAGLGNVQAGAAEALRTQLRIVTATDPLTQQLMTQAGTGLSDEIVASPPSTIAFFLGQFQKILPDAVIDFSTATVFTSGKEIRVRDLLKKAGLKELALGTGAAVVCSSKACLESIWAPK